MILGGKLGRWKIRREVSVYLTRIYFRLSHAETRLLERFVDHGTSPLISRPFLLTPRVRFSPLFRLPPFFPPFFASLFRAVAGNRRSRRARDGSYRYDAIADTRRGRLLRPPSPPRRPAPRYIDLFSSFAYELFRFGSPGVYSRMKICSAAKYFSVVPRLGPRVDPRFGPPCRSSYALLLPRA